MENLKYYIAGVIIFIALIILVYFLISNFKSYNIEGNYLIHPMVFINCIIKSKNGSKDEFDVTYKIDGTRFTSPSEKEQISKKHPNISDKKGLIKMTGEKNKLGNELLYIENSIKYNGIQLFEDLNLYAKKDDIVITTNETSRESIVFKKITK